MAETDQELISQIRELTQSLDEHREEMRVVRDAIDDRSSPGKFDYYLFGPLVGAPSAEKKKSAAWDLRKLATLTPPDTTHVCLILMGSARQKHQIGSELDRFAELAEIDRAPWSMRQRTWGNRHSIGYVYDCRIWTCAYGDVSEWWQRVSEKFVV